MKQHNNIKYQIDIPDDSGFKSKFAKGFVNAVLISIAISLTLIIVFCVTWDKVRRLW